jgi:hypothetical protein
MGDDVVDSIIPHAQRCDLAFSLFVREIEMAAVENHNHATRMVVERR